MKKPSAERAMKALNFDETLMEVKYPGKTHSISFSSKLRTELMKDADHNARKIGAVVRAIVDHYYFKGGFGGKGSSVGRERVDLGTSIKEAVHGISKEKKRELKLKAQMGSELSSVLGRFKEQAETKIGDDDNRMRMIELERAEATRKYNEQELKGITMKRKK